MRIELSCIENLIRYKHEINKIEFCFKGLPYANLVLIKSLVSAADPLTGIVTGLSYHDLASLLTVNPAPGRKDTGTPSKQTIRNYIKAIERECGDYFKVISEGQNLQFLFPEIPKIFSKVFENREVNTQVNPPKLLENTEPNGCFEEGFNTELNTEANTPSRPLKKLFILNNNTNNNNNKPKAVEHKLSKQPIAADFYPNPKTLERAIASGYSFAVDAEVIQAFIDKNTSWGSEFADFNPIYLSFLAQHKARTAQKQIKPSQTNRTRSATNERTPTKINSYDAAMDQVRRDYEEALTASGENLFPASCGIGVPEHTTHRLALG